MDICWEKVKSLAPFTNNLDELTSCIGKKLQVEENIENNIHMGKASLP